jgi:hypothetical protein
MANQVLSYLASPFSDANKKVMEERVLAACRCAGRLISSGVSVFSPIAHNVAIIRASGISTGWQIWSDYDKFMLARCDRLLVLRLEGWEKSDGVREEIKYARELGIPIEYIDE